MYKLRVKSFLHYSYTEYEVEFAKEATGFNYYLPKLFLLDVINFIAHKSYSNKDIFLIKDEISEFLEAIPQFIWEQTKKEYNILNKALYVLKYCGEIIDFKMLDNNKFSEVKSKDDNFYNKAKFEFELPLNVQNNVETNIDILNTLYGLFSKSVTSNKLNKACVGYKKITKIKKSLFMREDFGYKLTQQVSNKSVESNSTKDIIIFVEDTSSSMSEGKNKIIADTVKFFLCQMHEEIHYFTKNFDNITFIKLNTKEEKLDFFSTIKFQRDFYDYDLILNHISKIYNNQKIILLMDGEDYIPENIKLNNKIYILNTQKERNPINNLCKINNGKQICL
jgi:hypothetical protein